MDKRSSRIIKSASAFLAVLIIVVVILLINQKRRVDEHHKAVLKETINYNEEYDKRLMDFFLLAEDEFKAREADVAKRENDYIRYTSEEYGASHISMWDISALNGGLYPEFFGYPIVYSDYQYKTPMELREYLATILESGNDLNHIYINIDPFILEQNYNTATHYDDKPRPFEEYISSEILKLFNDYPDKSFELFLPARPTSYWATMQTEDYNSIMDKWYVFLMYLRWCPNVTVRYMGDQEWLVSNDYNYATSERLTDEVMSKVYMYLYAYVQYEITPPELKEKKGIIDKYIRKEKNGDYNICDLSSKKIVFLGDSLFDYISVNSLSVPGVVQRMTGAECYNLAISGTLASAYDPNGFTRVANALSMKSTTDYESRYKTEAERFLKNYSEDDDILFIILYGLNDYSSCVPLTEKDVVITDSDETQGDDSDEEAGKVVFKQEDAFESSVKYGIEVLKSGYPNADFMIVSPYGPDGNNGGKEPFAEGGQPLGKYVDMLKSISKSEGLFYYDMYNDGPINAKNRSEFLADGTHTNEKGAFLLGENIAKVIGTQYVE